MSGVIFGHVWNMSGVFFGHVSGMFWTCLVHVWDMSGTCFGHFWGHALDMFWICFGQVSDMFWKSSFEQHEEQASGNIWAIFGHVFGKVLLNYSSRFAQSAGLGKKVK